MVARIHEMIPTVKSDSSSEIYKILEFDRNYHFTLFQKIRIFSGFHNFLAALSFTVRSKFEFHAMLCVGFYICKFNNFFVTSFQ